MCSRLIRSCLASVPETCRSALQHLYLCFRSLRSRPFSYSVACASAGGTSHELGRGGRSKTARSTAAREPQAQSPMGTDHLLRISGDLCHLLPDAPLLHDCDLA